ncbi:MAG: AAA family ATPase [Oscillatoria sp. SIO1A7]|nr:AAA family ATPase [Oscillatoria sp. SIO1A7]
MSQSISREQDEPTEGITGISVRGYKSLYEERSIEIRPLTILAGANSSGKSSMMQPLLLIKQTLEAPYDPGALLLNGPNVRLTSIAQMLSRIDEKQSADHFSLSIEIDRDNSITNIYQKSPKGIMDIVETTIQKGDRSMSYSPDSSRDDIWQELRKSYKKDELFVYSKITKNNQKSDLKTTIYRDRSFLIFQYSSLFNVDYKVDLMEEINPIQYLEKIDVTIYDSSSKTSLFAEQIRKLIHVPAGRGKPERSYPMTAIGSAFPGTFENYVASIVKDWQDSEDDRLTELGKALEVLGLNWTVQAKQFNNDVQIELLVGRLPRNSKNETENLVSIADVGFGLSQVLPVVVALLVAEPGQLVYLEQPEIHLHPRAQAALAGVLADAANRGVRVVIETHSDLLLRRVQSLVAEGKLSPEKLKLHWFSLRDDGVTEVNSAELDDSGAFGEWPEDFSDVALEEEGRYLDAAESRLAERCYAS